MIGKYLLFRGKDNEKWTSKIGLENWKIKLASKPNTVKKSSKQRTLTPDPRVSDVEYAGVIEEIWQRYLENRKEENKRIIQKKGRGPSHVNNGRIVVGMTLGAGSFGRVFMAKNTETNQIIALKMESVEADVPQLKNEAKVYLKLKNGPGIPQIVWAGQELNSNWLAIELLGPSLEYLFWLCGKRFSLKTVLLIIDQVISIIQFLHSKLLIHRDIKHANFCVGQGYNCNKIYILDFGMAKTYPNGYFNRPNVKCQLKYRYMIGTELFCGINTHKGLEQSMRDDMESLGYLFAFLKRGTLPWAGLTAASENELEEKIKRCKISTPLSKICMGCPNEFLEYVKYSRQLEFHQIPNYKEMRQMFRNLALRLGIKYDFLYDWITTRLNLEDSTGST